MGNFIHRVSSLTILHVLRRHKFSVILYGHKQFIIKVCYLTTLFVANIMWHRVTDDCINMKNLKNEIGRRKHKYLVK
jgi:hypothetical protein